jgi:multiple sugar transport system substrate-binding protein
VPFPPLSHRVTAARSLSVLLVLLASVACDGSGRAETPVLKWYVFQEQSGAFVQAASRCSDAAGGAYRIETSPLPTDADQQREQLVRRLAAGDPDIDIVGMDVIWTAEFAEAGWILPLDAGQAAAVISGVLPSAVESVRYAGRLWAVPFTTNTQLLWYRTDRVDRPPETWDAMIRVAEALGEEGTIQVQGERYEGLTVFFTSLLASAGGAVLNEEGQVSLEPGPTRAALATMKRLATSTAAEPALSSSREDHGRLAFESGGSSFMVNYTYVWPSAQRNAPEVAAQMGWARWPSVVEGKPSRVTIGGINLGIGAHTRHAELAFEAAACLASAENQRRAATIGGLPPTLEALYDEPQVRATFPFAEVLRDTLRDAVQRAQSPVYNDISLAISRTLHPMRDIDPDKDAERLRRQVGRALRSEGLF